MLTDGLSGSDKADEAAADVEEELTADGEEELSADVKEELATDVIVEESAVVETMLELGAEVGLGHAVDGPYWTIR